VRITGDGASSNCTMASAEFASATVRHLASSATMPRTATTLTKLAEELIVFSTFEYGTVTLDDGFAMGSSMMPQKKNPGTLELLRGRAGRVNGLNAAAFTLMKGLPSGYNRDFHEDKEILIEIFGLILKALPVIPALIQSTTFNKDRMKTLTYGNFANATELANFLVAKKDIPFREAHHIVGSLVGELVKQRDNFSNVNYCMSHIQSRGVDISREEIEPILNPESVMLSYNSLGGTGDKSVEELIRWLESRVQDLDVKLAVDKRRVFQAYEACQSIAAEAKKIQSHEELVKLINKHKPE